MMEKKARNTLLHRRLSLFCHPVTGHIKESQNKDYGRVQNNIHDRSKERACVAYLSGDNES